MKKIMIIGNFKWEFYEEALAYGFEQNNIEVLRYKIDSLSLREKILDFYKLIKINLKLFKDIQKNKPDAIFLYRVNEILPLTFRKIKKLFPSLKIIIYHNDNPYIGIKNKFKYYLFLQSIKYSDITYVYRPSNILNAKEKGAKNIKILMPHFFSKRDLVKTINFDKEYDVVFIGHYEKNRAETIDYLIKNNIDVHIFGSYNEWKKAADKYHWSENVVNPPVYGEDYRKILSKSKIAICFLSRINKDVYTRRNFEIPVAGAAMASEYTIELAKIFNDEKDILFFKNKNELFNKIKKTINDQLLLKKIIINGYNKIVLGGHSEIDRAKQIIYDLGWIYDTN